MLFNARSLGNKLINLQSLIYSSNPGIVAITETWLNKDIFSNEILPHDYCIYRKDRSTRGSGVLIAVHNSIPSRIIDSPTEMELVTILLLNLNLFVCVVYVPPSIDLSLFKNILCFLESLAITNSILIMGDFNLPDINWSTLTSSSSSVHSDYFCEFVFDCYLTQLVDGPTHCKGNCLDLILSNTPDSVGPISISSHSLIQSDHYLLSFTLSVRNHSSIKSEEVTRYVLDLSKLNYTDMAEYLLDVDFSDCLLSTDANFIWCRLRSCILEVIDLLAPKVKLKPNKHSPCWFNSSIRHQINRVRTARKKTNAKPTDLNKQKLEDAERCLRDMMSAAKSSYESQLVNEFAFGNNSKIYKYINSIMKSDNLPDCMHLNGQSASSDTDKATLFNTFF